MRIKIIASNPRNGQTAIESLIGREFDVVIRHREGGNDDNKRMPFDGTISIVCNEKPFDGNIVIQPDEYEVIEHI